MSVSLPELLLVIVVLPFVWIIVDYFWGAVGQRREERRLQRLVRTCHLCGKSYPEEKKVKLSTCPECFGRNDRRGHRKLG